MREFMNIIEDAKSVVWSRIVKLIADQDGLFANPDDDDAETGIWTELLHQCINMAQSLADQPSVTVHRVMTLDEEDITGIQPGQSLGQYWATNQNFDLSNLAGGGPNVLFVGDARGQIMVEETAAQNYLFPDEHEVVFNGATIKLTGIFDIDTKSPIRQDLWGKDFKISDEI